jgi:rhodanese-related sulfurtransferase
VGEGWEVEIVALPGAVHIPLGELEQRLGELPPGPITAYCHHGIRSARARDILREHGIEASHLEGGIDAWARDNDPAMARY